eukprot:10148309-Prorocentrum_lima.AAC.1
MTSSLVGSEMCIRDSGGDGGGLSRGSQRGKKTPLAGAGAWVGGCAGAVSYTHLTLPTICSV